MVCRGRSFVTPARAAAFAGAWGSRLVNFERAGHLNADAGFGPLPEGGDSSPS